MARLLGKILMRPDIWPAAIRLGWRLGMRPDPAYMKFRMVTMYGDANAQPHAGDLVTYLRWCTSWEHVTR
ncbi:MAG: hypothetical protein F4129_08215 [Acidimicrobiia bacterium]|nr:hypothetical protein [Acidimicrobiia bacterium]MYL10538.1 hypothetical protein [Acidimicrobiia bacterium]